ncbi:hypothetical protein D3C78_1075700 [compost metagenome]
MSENRWPSQLAKAANSLVTRFEPLSSKVLVSTLINLPPSTKCAVLVNWSRIEKNKPTRSGEWARLLMWWFLVLILNR